jgi:hypothetical protein
LPPDPIRVAIQVAEALDRIGVRYAIGGSVASVFAGEPRSTEDVDIAADLRPEKIPALAAALSGEFYFDELAARDAAMRGGSFNIIHLELMQKVDIFVLGGDLLDRRQIERRRLAVVSRNPDQSLYLTSPEDMILRKLDWYRRGGGVSDRQWRDVIGIIKVQAGRLDLDYLRRTSADVGLGDLLAQALRAGGHHDVKEPDP